MKLIFSPYYDQALFTGKGDGCTLGVKYVGPMGLLDELELRSGLSKEHPGQMDRVMKYCEALAECGNDSPNPDNFFFWKSFNADMLNVAARLLEWRDALVYAGLKRLSSVPGSVSAGANAILSDLLKVEEYFEDDHSAGDRWMLLSGEKEYLSGGWEIEVRMKKELVEPVILECLLKSGAQCTFADVLPKPDHKVNMLKFANLTDGYQWAFTEDNGNADVYVNQDNLTLNAVFDCLGVPNVDSSSSGAITTIIQLFTKGMKLFASPVDYDALVAYLSVPVHPLNDYVCLEDKCLRTVLLSHLTSMGGFGTDDRHGLDWDGIIKTARLKDGRKTHVPLEYCIGQWNLVQNAAMIEKYCECWEKWLVKEAVSAKSEAVRQQLHSVINVLRILPGYYAVSPKGAGSKGAGPKGTGHGAAGKGVGGICNSNEIPWGDLDHDSRGGNPDFPHEQRHEEPNVFDIDFGFGGSLGVYPVSAAAKDAPEVVEDMKAVAAECKKAVWMDAYEKGASAYAYSFLNDEDILELNKAGMLIPLYDNQLKADDAAMQIAYAFVKEELVVLTPERVECVKKYPVQIPHWCGSVMDKTMWVPNGISVETQEAAQQRLEHEVSPEIFEKLKMDKKDGGIRREYESFSSLKELIHNPFDYVLEYLFECPETSRNHLSVAKGNVVHRMINAAVVAANCDWAGIKDALVNNFDANFDKAVEDVGMELLMSKNRLEYSLFRQQVKDCSIKSFIEVVESNSLSVVESETDFMVDFDEIGQYNAKIDMVLKDSNGKYVIMDFKWTDGKASKRENEIKENTEMQLALYAEAVRKHYCKGDASAIAAVGYFMLRQGVFITEYDGFAKSKKVRTVKKISTDPVFDMVKNAYKFRMEQLIGESGKSVIEDAEGVKLPNDDLAYTKVKRLFPLEVSSTGCKASAYDKNVVLKGILK